MQKAIAVTASIGTPWRAYSKLLTDRMNQLAEQVPDGGGLRCLDISEQVPWDKVMARHVFLCKLYIWDIVPKDIEGVLWVDSDVFQPIPIPISALPTSPIAAIQDPWQRLDQPERKKSCLGPGRKDLINLTAYFNAGIFWMSRKAVPMIEKSKVDVVDMFRRSYWPDQDIFNWETPRMFGSPANQGRGWDYMDPRLNAIMWHGQVFAKDPYLIHFCAMQDKFAHMKAAYRAAGLGTPEETPSASFAVPPASCKK